MHTWKRLYRSVSPMTHTNSPPLWLSYLPLLSRVHRRPPCKSNSRLGFIFHVRVCVLVMASRSLEDRGVNSPCTCYPGRVRLPSLSIHGALRVLCYLQPSAYSLTLLNKRHRHGRYLTLTRLLSSYTCLLWLQVSVWVCASNAPSQETGVTALNKMNITSHYHFH